MITRYFLGCNSPEGFYSLFPQFTQPEAGYRCILIKGGPGTGKSTLMRRIEKRCLQEQRAVEEIHCSSDADSLDGVILPTDRIAILDATPPHTLEPQYPGAVEQPFSLCECWDVSALRAQRGEIVSLSREIAGLHRQATRYLSAAAQVTEEVRSLAEAHTDRKKVLRYAHSIAERELPRREHPGSECRRLLSAITNKGPLLYSETLETIAPRLCCIEDPYGAASSMLISALREEALSRGYDVISCPCPLAPTQRIDHLLIPSLGLGFSTSNRLHPVAARCKAVHAQRFTAADAMKECRVRVRFLQKTADLLLRQAALSMESAKARHDALEQIYRSSMDFNRVNECSAALLQEISNSLD